MKKIRFWKTVGVILLVTMVLWSVAAIRQPRIKLSPLFDLPPWMEEEILAVESGRYSESLPIFAWEIRMLEGVDGYVRYKVVYFPLGSIERSYTRAADGTWNFNLEEPLTRIKIVRLLPEKTT